MLFDQKLIVLINSFHLLVLMNSLQMQYFQTQLIKSNHCFSDSSVKKNCTLAPGFWVGLTVFESNGDSGHLCREDQVSLTHLDPPTFNTVFAEI